MNTLPLTASWIMRSVDNMISNTLAVWVLLANAQGLREKGENIKFLPTEILKLVSRIVSMQSPYRKTVFVCELAIQ